MLHSSTLSRPRAGLRHTGSFMDRLIRLDDLLRERRALRNMDRVQMRDLGLTEDEIEKELRTPIWRHL